MGGSFGGGAGGVGGGGGEQALLKSRAGISSKMINPDIYFIGDVFHLMHLIVYSFLSLPPAPFPSLVNHGGEEKKLPGCTNITVRARARSTISSESDCKCVIVPNISSHMPKHSQEVKFIFPWLMYQQLLTTKATINGSEMAANRRTQIPRRRSVPRHSSAQGIIYGNKISPKKRATLGVSQASGIMAPMNFMVCPGISPKANILPLPDIRKISPSTVQATKLTIDLTRWRLASVEFDIIVISR